MTFIADGVRIRPPLPTKRKHNQVAAPTTTGGKMTDSKSSTCVICDVAMT